MLEALFKYLHDKYVRTSYFTKCTMYLGEKELEDPSKSLTSSRLQVLLDCLLSEKNIAVQLFFFTPLKKLRNTQ